jgi:hypothetical protein
VSREGVPPPKKMVCTGSRAPDERATYLVISRHSASHNQEFAFLPGICVKIAVTAAMLAKRNMNIQAKLSISRQDITTPSSCKGAVVQRSAWEPFQTVNHALKGYVIIHALNRKIINKL